jgi:hypothetical protein
MASTCRFGTSITACATIIVSTSQTACEPYDENEQAKNACVIDDDGSHGLSNIRRSLRDVKGNRANIFGSAFWSVSTGHKRYKRFVES